MICVICKRDINAIGQDNVSPFPGLPVCEDCASEMPNFEWRKLEKEADEE
jgi:hypothetical protein